MKAEPLKPWHERIGFQRDWIWRGWQVRYSFRRSHSLPPTSPETPLLLIHGFGAALEHWRHNIPILSQKRTVYALDLLGFGASRKAAPNYTVELWVEQIYEFWQTFIGAPIVLVGNSLGSLVCLVAAAHHPEMVKGVVLLNIPDVSVRQEMLPPFVRPVVNRLEGLFGSPPLLVPVFQLLRRRFTIRRWASLAYPHPEAITDELVEILAAPAYDQGAAATFCALFQSIRQPEFSPRLLELFPQISRPILLIWGRQDCMVPFTLSQRFLGKNPHLTFVPLEKVGHCPHDEVPAQFHQVLLPWLEKFA
ncbi:alpha/beta fold hydrolase [Spirulina subsalsa FACHB-351]|uniref:Alpha/beta fold hydrolase n=1 Tax=Spirulina subsalsa FACHB-351 TaxID=234711 RepID=A0ABT3L3H7_9CYAN|nr:alpha/beta fold hydrolase [Spirulina subsalsa]MCW6036030.1 alpha/beta fold hydrolase [Spirulina subsalsa FACHB-351]